VSKSLNCPIKKAVLRIALSSVLLAAVVGGQSPSVSDSKGSVKSDSNLTVTVNKSIVLEHSSNIRRISVSSADLAEAVAVSSTEVLVNGKAPGDTTLLLWDVKGNRSEYEVHVVANDSRVDAVRNELVKEVGSDVSMSIESGNVFLRGTVSDPVVADRAQSIAGTLGKVVNLLRVQVPPGEAQILLKVRFANISRSTSQQLGVNLFSTNQKGVATSTTGQFGAPPAITANGQGGTPTFSDLLNIFYFRPDLNLGAFIQALEAKSLLEILAEPNLLTVSGKPASFLAGGEYPFPTIQGGAAGVGQITIQFKEFGIRLGFLPTVTPRGTIRLVVNPEVSSLDYSNALTVGGYTVPGLATRRVQTEVELETGQSFVIAGLLDNQTTEQLNKIPGLANIPVLGKLFQSRSISKSNSELMIIVTPELVRPIPADVKAAGLEMPLPFMKDGSAVPPQQPGSAVTGPAPALPKVDSLPLEVLKGFTQTGSSGRAPSSESGSMPPLAQPATPFASAPNSAPNH